MTKIYKLTAPNGKVYIGASAQEDIKKRWGYGCNYAFNRPLFEDIKKYGWHDFKKEVIETCDNDDSAARERYWILEYNSNNPVYGYNRQTNFSSPGVQASLKDEKKMYIRCKETGQIFNSMAEAGRFYGITRAYISKLILLNKPYRDALTFEKIYLTKDELKAALI